MVVISSSKLRLNPGEAVIDPALAGVAWVSKTIGGRTHQALVKASAIGKDPEHLKCFPYPLPRPGPDFTRETGDWSININAWTTWKMSNQDFQTLEWVKDQHQHFIKPTQVTGQFTGMIDKVLEQHQHSGEATQITGMTDKVLDQAAETDRP